MIKKSTQVSRKKKVLKQEEVSTVFSQRSDYLEMCIDIPEWCIKDPKGIIVRLVTKDSKNNVKVLHSILLAMKDEVCNERHG